MNDRLSITPGFCFLAALVLLLMPLRWGLGLLLAVLVHELFHCLAVLVCNGQFYSLSIGGLGARIEIEPMTAGKEIFCALAGPAGSFTMLLMTESFPEAAICGLIQGLYNLLPIFPLDGGRVLRCLFSDAVCTGIMFFTLTLLSGTCFLAAEYMPDLAGILLVFLWLPVIQRKFSCNAAKVAVQ